MYTFSVFSLQTTTHRFRDLCRDDEIPDTLLFLIDVMHPLFSLLFSAVYHNVRSQKPLHCH